MKARNKRGGNENHMIDEADKRYAIGMAAWSTKQNPPLHYFVFDLDCIPSRDWNPKLKRLQWVGAR